MALIPCSQNRGDDVFGAAGRPIPLASAAQRMNIGRKQRECHCRQAIFPTVQGFLSPLRPLISMVILYRPVRLRAHRIALNLQWWQKSWSSTVYGNLPTYTRTWTYAKDEGGGRYRNLYGRKDNSRPKLPSSCFQTIYAYRRGWTAPTRISQSNFGMNRRPNSEIRP
jgi:hypothetical protein